MRWLLTISLLFLFTQVFSREDPADLSKRLTANCKTELEKVKVIFRWITDNISYRIRPQVNKKNVSSYLIYNAAEPIDEMNDDPPKSLIERVAETTLQRREAVCDGYARLFTSLCDHAGIRSEIIIGFAKSGNNKPIQRFGVNHYWNAVNIDNNWYLLDATWASGFVTLKGDAFIREYDENYFLTPPEIFIRDHYPDDARWILLPDSKIPKEFLRFPFKQKSFVKYQFTSFYPSGGIIEANLGDTVHLTLETGSKTNGRNISPDMLVDSAIFSYSSSWIFLRPCVTENLESQQLHRYVYTVSSPDVDWLYLLYNDDLVLRYKINVKKKKT